MNGAEIRTNRIVVQSLGDEERDKFGYLVNKSKRKQKKNRSGHKHC